MWGIPTQKSSIEVIPQEKGSIRTNLHHLHPPLQYHSIYPHHGQYYNITHPDREHFESRIHPNFTIVRIMSPVFQPFYIQLPSNGFH